MSKRYPKMRATFHLNNIPVELSDVSHSKVKNKSTAWSRSEKCGWRNTYFEENYKGDRHPEADRVIKPTSDIDGRTQEKLIYDIKNRTMKFVEKEVREMGTQQAKWR